MAAFIAPVLPSRRPRSRASRCPRACALPPDAAQPTDAAQPESPDPLEKAYEAVRAGINAAFNKLYAPMPALLPPLLRPFAKTPAPNYILHPDAAPKAVIHFLGGAFFGAAPHLLYHTLLTKLCARGYVVVATPYELSFDYLPLTERICGAWETVETDLAARYGPLPVVGLGHSAGCLFHALSACLFEELSPRAGLVLVSFNNRGARDAIPMYEAMVAPLSRAAVSLRDGLPADARGWLERLPAELDALVAGPLAPDVFLSDVFPTVKEGRRFLEQVPMLFEEIADADDGEVREFYPSPADVKKAVEGLYPVEQTLVVRFRDDSLDDSDAITDAVKRRGVDVSVVELKGSHITPLAQEPVIGGIGGLVGEMVAGVSVGELEQLVNVVDEWVESGLANDRL